MEVVPKRYNGEYAITSKVSNHLKAWRYACSFGMSWRKDIGGNYCGRILLAVINGD